MDRKVASKSWGQSMNPISGAKTLVSSMTERLFPHGQKDADQQQQPPMSSPSPTTSDRSSSENQSTASPSSCSSHSQQEGSQCSAKYKCPGCGEGFEKWGNGLRKHIKSTNHADLATCTQQDCMTDPIVAESEEARKKAKRTVVRSIPYPERQPTDGVRIAMSACLMGHEVRYNAGHCMARNIIESMGKVFKFVPVCPEVDIGLGTPRPTLRLCLSGKKENSHLDRRMDIEDFADHVQLWCPDLKKDFTAQMRDYALAKVDDLRDYGIDGFVLKKDSPSCGVGAVKLYENRQDGVVRGVRMAQGLFTRTLMKEWPELAVSDEAMLGDSDKRNNYINHVLCHQDWRQQYDGSYDSLVQFHACHRYSLMAQSSKVLAELDALLDKGEEYFLQQQEESTVDVGKIYYRKFFAAMKIMVGRQQHADVLTKISAELVDHVKPALASEINQSIEEYRDGLVPFVVPLSLVQLGAKMQQNTLSSAASESDAATGKSSTSSSLLLSKHSFVQGAPHVLKAHTSISSKVNLNARSAADCQDSIEATS